MSSTWLTVLILTTLCASLSVAHPQIRSFAASSFQEMSSGPHGMVLGRQGYHDSTGHGHFISYTVDKGGHVQIRHDPTGRVFLTHLEKTSFPHTFHLFRSLLTPDFGLSSLKLLPRFHQPFLCLLNPCSSDSYINRHDDQYMRMMHGIA
ncbi:hypothetical protein HPB49_008675 [Dermacentor silvarum]|uniref:Uncharacterized protein n=1 Tax=Dermacentor silvarum TaxID=543639 RepID=A0ACB8C8J2_DERSI|nr:uncharacterized protein LOC119460813 [Dermacentor silvarum]XP_037577835.1 uncharacterized protein LOC119460813 [Dermacentor silvarum]KAH7937199.1 hypothetical protein HPB49_008675 [Dermacentor silvarum]